MAGGSGRVAAGTAAGRDAGPDPAGADRGLTVPDVGPRAVPTTNPMPTMAQAAHTPATTRRPFGKERCACAVAGPTCGPGAGTDGYQRPSAASPHVVPTQGRGLRGLRESLGVEGHPPARRQVAHGGRRLGDRLPPSHSVGRRVDTDEFGDRYGTRRHADALVVRRPCEVARGASCRHKPELVMVVPPALVQLLRDQFYPLPDGGPDVRQGYRPAPRPA